MPLFHNTRRFLLPSVGCATFVLLFSACTSAHAESKNGDKFGASKNDQNRSSLDDVTLTLNYQGKSYTIFDEDKPAEGLGKASLHLSIGSIIHYAADSENSQDGQVNFGFEQNAGKKNDDKFFSSFSRDDHHGDDKNNSFCDDGKGNHNNGGGDPSNGNGGCGGGGNNGSGNNNSKGGCGGDPGGNDGGGMPATPEPSAVYLSAVAAGLMSLMLLRRNLRSR
jgi:hypothetical protein